MFSSTFLFFSQGACYVVDQPRWCLVCGDRGLGCHCQGGPRVTSLTVTRSACVKKVAARSIGSDSKRSQRSVFDFRTVCCTSRPDGFLYTALAPVPNTRKVHTQPLQSRPGSNVTRAKRAVWSDHPTWRSKQIQASLSGAPLALSNYSRSLGLASVSY